MTINTPAEEFYTNRSLDYFVAILWCISPGRCKKTEGRAQDILVGGLEHFLFFHMLGIIPTDFHIFQRGWNHQYISICVFLQVGCVVLNGFSRASIQFLGNQVLDKHRLNLPAALV